MVRAAELIFVRSPVQRLPALTILVGITFILDGIGFNFFPSWYKDDHVKKVNPQLATQYSRTGAAYGYYRMMQKFCDILYFTYTVA